MLANIIIGGCLGLLGGAIGDGLARLITKATGGDTTPKWPRILGLVLAISLTRPLADYWNRPTADSVMQGLETTEPAYAALKTKQPAVYAEIKADIAGSIANGEDPAILRNKMRAAISRLYAVKLPKAADANLVMAIGVIRDETKAIGQTNPTLCVGMLSPQGADISSSLPKDLAKKDDDMMAQIISGDDVPNGKVASGADVQSFAVKAFQNISNELHVPFVQVVAASQGKGTDDLKCQVSSKLFDQFLKLPTPEQGPMIRGVMFTK